MTQPINSLVITEFEHKCMKYLSNKMEVTAGMVGVNIYNRLVNNPAHIGASVLGNLHKKGLVMKIPELCAWRLTAKGRDYVSRR